MREWRIYLTYFDLKTSHENGDERGTRPTVRRGWTLWGWEDSD